MNDTHNQTDKLLRRFLVEAKKSFSKDYHDLKIEMNNLISQAKFKDGMTGAERLAEANKHNLIDKVADLAIKSLQGTNAAVIERSEDFFLSVYELNYNDATGRIEKMISEQFGGKPKADIAEGESILRSSKYLTRSENRAKSAAVLKSRLKPRITKALRDGESVTEAVKTVANGSLANNGLRATTETTRLENAGRQEAYNDIRRKYGFEYVIMKKWHSQKDPEVRFNHVWVDGQEVKSDAPFYVKTEQMMYPCDPRGSAENVCNCRCYMTERVVKVN